MDTENVALDSDGVLDDRIFEFFGKGGTFKNLKNISGDAMEAIYSVAYNLYQNEKYDEAVKIFQFLCFYDHFNKKYFMGLGACQQMLKNFESALEVFTFATVLDDEDPRPTMYVADCYLALGNEEKAKEAYGAAMERAGDNSEYSQEKQRAENMLDNMQ